jgi:hypothetical protein
MKQGAAARLSGIGDSLRDGPVALFGASRPGDEAKIKTNGGVGPRKSAVGDRAGTPASGGAAGRPPDPLALAQQAAIGAVAIVRILREDLYAARATVVMAVSGRSVASARQPVVVTVVTLRSGPSGPSGRSGRSAVSGRQQTVESVLIVVSGRSAVSARRRVEATRVLAAASLPEDRATVPSDLGASAGRLRVKVVGVRVTGHRARRVVPRGLRTGTRVVKATRGARPAAG